MSWQALAPAVAFAAAAGVIALLTRHARRLPQSSPNARTLHDGSIPRAGGVAILAGALIGVLVAPPALAGAAGGWLLAITAVAAVSFADDVRGVPVVIRLGVQGLAALVVAAQLMVLPASLPIAIAIAIGIAWGANLFNFMDGSDGLAASMAIVGFASYAVAAAVAGAPWGAYAAIAAAVIPFLVVNRPRASMFMGDVGAVTLGFAAAALGVAGSIGGSWPAWFPLLVFMPFVADATVTLALRALRGEPVWRAHRSHFYQRLNTLGAGHRGTLAIYVAAMLACSTFALACLTLAPGQGFAALAIAAAAHACGFALIDYHCRRQKGAGL